MFVDDCHILKNECGERFEMDLIKMNLSIKLFRKVLYNLICCKSLYSWELYNECSSEENDCNCNNYDPRYFEKLFDNALVYEV